MLLLAVNVGLADLFRPEITFGYEIHVHVNNEIKASIFSLLGVQAYADALLIIIKTLAQNSGLDPQESIVRLQEEYTEPEQGVGLDIKTGRYT